MVKNHENKKKYKDSEPGPLFNACKEGRVKTKQLISAYHDAVTISPQEK
jgi:hypothetical protein